MTSTTELLAVGTGLTGLVVAIWARIGASRANTLSEEANQISEQARRDAKAATDRANELAAAQLVLNAGVALAEAGQSAIEKLQAKGQTKLANGVAQIMTRMTRRLNTHGLDAIKDARSEMARLLGPKVAKQFGLA